MYLKSYLISPCAHCDIRVSSFEILDLYFVKIWNMKLYQGNSLIFLCLHGYTHHFNWLFACQFPWEVPFTTLYICSHWSNSFPYISSTFFNTVFWLHVGLLSHLTCLSSIKTGPKNFKTRCKICWLKLIENGPKNFHSFC